MFFLLCYASRFGGWYMKKSVWRDKLPQPTHTEKTYYYLCHLAIAITILRDGYPR